MKTLRFTTRYFPLPHPTSTPIEPSLCSFKNFSTNGQGYTPSSAQNSRSTLWTHTLYLVDEKCDAISSYTECTCCSSYASPRSIRGTKECPLGSKVSLMTIGRGKAWRSQFSLWRKFNNHQLSAFKIRLPPHNLRQSRFLLKSYFEHVPHSVQIYRASLVASMPLMQVHLRPAKYALRICKTSIFGSLGSVIAP